MVKFWPRWNGNGFCQSTIVVDGFSMVFLHVNHWYQWFFNGFFYMWTIGINGFSMDFLHVNHWCQWFFNGFSDLNHWYGWFFQCFFLQSNHCHCINGLWLTIDIDGLSMVLGKVNAGSQKKAKTQKNMICSTKTQE